MHARILPPGSLCVHARNRGQHRAAWVGIQSASPKLPFLRILCPPRVERSARQMKPALTLFTDVVPHVAALRTPVTCTEGSFCEWCSTRVRRKCILTDVYNDMGSRSGMVRCSPLAEVSCVGWR